MNKGLKQLTDLENIAERITNISKFPKDIISHITKEKYFNLWVPKEFNGLESSMTEGLKTLYQLAKIDGTLGWTVTLCAGANYFIGNMCNTAKEAIFRDKLPILGGSGGKWGTAKCYDDYYVLNGTWKYATGAEYLTHFTLNAVLVEDGNTILDADGNEAFLSFVVPAEAVTIISDWDRMGMKATTTNSFSIDNYKVSKDYSFMYNHFELPQLIFKIPFQVFADLTLWVNYAGMFAHFVTEVEKMKGNSAAQPLLDLSNNYEEKFEFFVAKVNNLLTNQQLIPDDLKNEIFEFCSKSVQQMAQSVIQIWPYLGTKAASESASINVIFRDFFTATQHHNFIRNKTS